MSKRSIEFSPTAWQHYLYWHAGGSKLVSKINRLLEDIVRDPFHGLGKPEPLREKLSGYWSRRINDEHRLVYEVQNDRIIVHSCRHHYGKD